MSDGVDFHGPFSDSTMDLVRDYASEAFETARGYMDELGDYIVGPIETTPPDIELNPQPDPEPPISPPSLADSFPTAPTEPQTAEHEFPPDPQYTLPLAPVLSTIVLPVWVPGVINPPTSTLPADPEAPPTISPITTEDVAFDALVSTIRSKLSDNILLGGTMLNPTVEADIWDRDLERHEQALQDAIDKATGQWAKLGFSLPDGLLASNLLAINNEYLNRRLDRSREIAVKQAELEQGGMFKSLEMGIAFEKVIIASGHEYLKRVFESAKATADVTIELYKQRAAQFGLLLERFKADVLHYKTQIEAEMTRAEVYKSEISAQKLVVDIDESKVKLYLGHIEAITKVVEVYNTQVKAVAIKYEAEKTKIDGFRGLVEAYVGKVNAIVSRWGAKVDLYKADVQRWSAASDAKVKIMDITGRIDIAELEATLKAWEVQLRIAQESTSTKLEALKTVAQTSSNLAAGALSAMHASVSDSYGESLSESHSYSY